MVGDGFAILKVRPGLAYALREALYALELAAGEVDGGPRALHDTMERLMQADPGIWTDHILGSAASQQSQRHYGLADRIRDFWPTPEATTAADALHARVHATRRHIGLVSQYLGGLFVKEALEVGDDLGDPAALIRRAVRRSLRPWLEACA